MSENGPDPAHGRCPAHSRSGNPCGHPAGYGTDHVGIGCCKFHGGSSPNHRRSAQLVMARQECDRLGIAIEVDPGEALLHGVWEAAGNVEFYRSLVSDGEEDLLTEERGVGGARKIVEHPLVRLYNEERDRLSAYSQAALKAGVEERRVRLAEAEARELFGAVSKALEAMGLSDRFDDFRVHFAAALRSGGHSRPAAVG